MNTYDNHLETLDMTVLQDSKEIGTEMHIIWKPCWICEVQMNIYLWVMDQTNFMSTTTGNSLHSSNRILNYFVQQNDSYSYCGQVFVTMYTY